MTKENISVISHRPSCAKDRNQIQNSYPIYLGHLKQNCNFLLIDVNF